MRKLTIILLFIISLLTLMFYIFPKKSFSEIENRFLSTNPSLTFDKLISGEYMEKEEKYIQDNFPFRDAFMYIKTFIYKLVGISKINGVYLGNDGYLLDEYDNIDYKDELIKTINSFVNKNKDVNYNIMLLPNKISIYDDKLPKNVSLINQNEEIDSIYKNLSISNKINMYDIFKKEKDKHDLYYKTDHHWTMYGAYLAYQEYCKKNNLISYSEDFFNKKIVSNDFLGSSFSKVTDYNAKHDVIEIYEQSNLDIIVSYLEENKISNTLYNFDYLKKKDKYSIFLDNNHPIINITNNLINNDDNLLIIKDSFANSLVPFLVNHYKKIDVVDPRYYKRSISKYIKDNNIKNVLFVYNLGTLSIDKNILSIR